jgi:putative toxin-antitoxin system antitoxin component (TIGR02293 family)
MATKPSMKREAVPIQRRAPTAPATKRLAESIRLGPASPKGANQVLIKIDRRQGSSHKKTFLGKVLDSALNWPPAERIRIESEGVPTDTLDDLAQRLHLAKARVLEIVDASKSTVAKRQQHGEPLQGASAHAAVALIDLISSAREIAAKSTHPQAKQFDAEAWLGRWLDRAHPALAHQRPGDLIKTPTGAEMVRRTLWAVQTGAYQ